MIFHFKNLNGIIIFVLKLPLVPSFTLIGWVGAELQSMMASTSIRDRQTDVGLSSTQLVLVYYHLAEITYQTRLSWITAELCPGLAKTYHQPKFRCAWCWVFGSKVYLMFKISSSITEKMSLWIYCLPQCDEFLI